MEIMPDYSNHATRMTEERLGAFIYNRPEFDGKEIINKDPLEYL